MRRILLFLSGCLFFSLPADAQHFSAIQTGPVVSTPSGSRSVQFLDLNQDGFDDLIITNGLSSGENNLLYINDQQGGFQVMLNDPFTADNSPSDGATLADTDNDGDLDAYVTTWHGTFNQFYENQGDGSFIDQSTNGTVPATSYAETASWGDYDLDGFVDLFVTNSFGNKRNWLFHNDGNGQFTRIDTGLVTTEFLSSRSVHWVDYDQDQDFDLFISNEGVAKNSLFRNEGNGYFKKITGSPVTDGFANSTGSSWADVDNDRDLDLFVANYNQNNQLFLNDGSGQFTEVDAGDLSNDGGCSFGSSFADFDNDGDLDLVVANGFCTGNLNNFVYRNLGNGQFQRVDTTAINSISGWSFGLAWADYNQDGFQDLAIANCKDEMQTNSLFRNEGNENNWFQLDAIGSISNRSAIGLKISAKATINGQEIWQYREISAQDGYCSQNSLRVHFGLGDATVVDSLILNWPSGISMSFTGEASNQIKTVLEMGSNSIQSQVSNFEWSVFPNPAQYVLNLQFSSAPAKGSTLILWNQKGQKVATYQFSEEILPSMGGQTSWRWNLKKENIPNGNYWLEFQSKGIQDSISIILIQ